MVEFEGHTRLTKTHDWQSSRRKVSQEPGDRPENSVMITVSLAPQRSGGEYWHRLPLGIGLTSECGSLGRLGEKASCDDHPAAAFRDLRSLS